jgi:Mrp family chromosome partitioning ATPase
MSNAHRSLLERAADVYDFGSGLKVAPPADLPPPRIRRVAPAPEAAPAPAAAPADAAPPLVAPVRSPPPVQFDPAPVPAPAAKPAPRPDDVRRVPHARVTIDRESLAASGFVLPDDAASGLAEEMRLIKRRLIGVVDAAADKGDERARTVLIASGHPGEGKTFIALNLALSLAGEQDRTVLLIDGDTGKAELPTRLGIDEHPGLVDALADRIDPETLVLDTDIPRLSLLTAGRKERNVPELLASARTGDVLRRLLAADPRRIILVDSPPVLAASPAAVLAPLLGQCLVVVRADATNEADLKETISLLSGNRHLSLVLNSTAFSIGGRRFGRYEEYR